MQEGTGVAAQWIPRQPATDELGAWQPLPVAVAVACLMFTLSVAGWVAWSFIPQLAAEDHWLEWLQVVLLLSASVVHCRYGKLSSGPGLVHAGLGILTLSFAFREMDIDKLGTAAAWAVAETVIRVANAMLLAWWGWAAWRRLPALLRALLGALRRPWPWLTVLAGVLYASSWPLDKELLPLPADVALFLEELLELQATTVLLLAALAMQPARRRRGDPAADARSAGGGDSPVMARELTRG